MIIVNWIKILLNINKTHDYLIPCGKEAKLHMEYIERTKGKPKCIVS